MDQASEHPMHSMNASSTQFQHKVTEHYSIVPLTTVPSWGEQQQRPVQLTIALKNVPSLAATIYNSQYIKNQGKTKQVGGIS